MFFIIRKIKSLLTKLIYPHSYSAEAYQSYLRDNGVKIGNHTRFINCSIDINRGEYITIGSNCLLTHVSIIAHDYSWYVFKDAYDSMLPDPGGEVVIGNNCFIGYGSIILKNTNIGDNVIVGAGSVIKGYVPSNTVWAGIPARQICTLEEMYQKKAAKRIEDAFYRYEILCRRKEKPNVEDMKWFGMLFLERSTENYDKYIKQLKLNGQMNRSDVKAYFFNTLPVFNGFSEFCTAYNLLHKH